MKLESRYNLFLMGYLIFPFISFLLCLKYYKSSWFKNALWLFIIFFGFAMSFVDTIDAFAYKEMFDISANSFKNSNSFLDVFDASVTGQIDFAVSLINYILTLFTDNYHFLFGVYGIIFGYFYSRNIDFVLRQINSKHSKSIIGLVFFLACYIGIWQINGFRFWTATHIFVYGLIHYLLLEKKKKGFIFILLSLTVHFSFFIPFLIFLVYKFIPKFHKIFIISTLILATYNPLSNLEIVESYLTQYAINDQFKRKAEVYTSEEVVEKAGNASSKTDTTKVIIGLYQRTLILIIAFFLVSKLPEVNNNEKNIFDFGLVLALIGAILSFVPSGGRFLYVGLFILFFSTVIILLKYQFYYAKFKLLSYFGIIATILIIPANIWIFSVFSVHTILGNYFTVFLDTTEVFYSLYDLLKFIII